MNSNEKIINYKPDPIDLSNIDLPKDIIGLTDVIAKNVHEVWAYKKIKEGWKYGQRLDQMNKFHPCLIPYELLTVSEKEYDRETALQTLKLMIKYGYKIIKD